MMAHNLWIMRHARLIVQFFYLVLAKSPALADEIKRA
jgi:hypothetical protein